MHGSSIRLWLYSVPAIVGVLAGLWHYSLAGMDHFRVVVIAALLGWLAYRYLLPFMMIKRRALLAHVTTDSSWARRIFWNSILGRLVLAVSSVITALFVLVMVTGLQLFEWYVLFGSVLSFLALYLLCNKSLGGQFSAEHRFPFTLRIASRINLAVMTIALVAVQILWLEVDDTRYLSISEVFQSAYAQHSASAALDEVGWLIGLNSAVSYSLWHIMQLTSGADSSVLTKMSAWLAFLVFSAIKLGAIWTVLLGIPSLVFELLKDKKSDPQSRRRGILTTAIAASVVLGSGAYLLNSQVTVAPFINSLSGTLRQTLVNDPCQRQAPIEQQELAAQAERALTQQQKQLMVHMEQEIDRHVDHAFAKADVGVDSFLDWNFSLRGQYTQLLFLSRSMVGETSFAEHLGERMDSHIDEAIGPGLSSLNDRLNVTFSDGLNQAYAKHDAYLNALVQRANCVTLATPDLPLTDYVNKSLVGTGFVVGPAAGVLAVRAGTRAALPAARATAGTGSRVAARPASNRVISQMFARLTARAAAGAASGSAGAVCGPFMIACGSAFAAATWIGMDIAINEVDEAINRQQMREDMLTVLSEQKAALKAELKEQYSNAASLAFEAVEEYQSQTFNIRRDGFGRG
ncbi:hypothetical protein [Marinimicrobium sp. ABcell2]|uniref:hypothetical protein n=1 Tax=Marinimicrobium sp. ABcell2 TaxID=3069751 RepID=UPI0027B4932F|nr:hypothetical protein [Marinimicrobium sp. ABcell2]MDQ2076879.1 hypothetical protein [Marinimicrobium sp. ABcell2]